MRPDLHEDLVRAVRRTLEARTARVVVSWWVQADGDPASALPPERPRAEGIVDFESDRCALEAPTFVPGRPSRLGRDVQFELLDDGRWVRSLHEDRWPLFHPKWPLEALESGSRSIVPRVGEAESVDLVFDPRRIAALAGSDIGPGSWLDFTGTARRDGEGRITWMEIVALAPRVETPIGQVVATNQRMELAWQFHAFGLPVEIEFPPRSSLLESADYVAELHERWAKAYPPEKT